MRVYMCSVYPRLVVSYVRTYVYVYARMHLCVCVYIYMCDACARVYVCTYASSRVCSPFGVMAAFFN